MSKPYRAGNGKFVKRDNPIAVIGRLQEMRRIKLEADAIIAAEARRAQARRNGYRGPVTRADLARGVQS